jgi:eukaryotic-like serine/threonine-protein kinase
MAADPIDGLLDSLVAPGLITPLQRGEIRAWATTNAADRPIVAKELVRRGWLTSFQIKEVAKGQVANLTIGPYLVLDLLGEGGMGRVFRAKHTRLNRQVALKVIREEKLSNQRSVNRFLQEIHAAAQLSHPNVVLAYDAESADRTLFLSMEYVEGTDLTKLVAANGPMPFRQACDAIRQAALGLQHAHEMGLVHRDIKPSNLLYTPKGQVKVLDLGLAMLNQKELKGGDQPNRVTQDGFIIGTPDFLAPEQAQNSGNVDTRADVYSLGATLYYLLTGQVPYDAPTPTEKLIKHITEPPPSLLRLRPDAPPQLDAVVRWMMAKRPEVRPQTPANVALALSPFCPGGPVNPVVSQSFGHDPIGSIAPSPPPDEPEQLGPDANSVWADDTVRPVKVRVPRRASSLPLLLIAGGVLVAACGGLLGMAYYYLVAPVFEKEEPLGEEFTNAVNQRMLRIEAGSFQMGSPDTEEGRDKSEGPQHPVKISSPFFVSSTEVTRAEFVAVMNRSPGVSPPGMSEKLLPRLPATGVSWADANEFCKQLNSKEASRRKGWEYRLPTEAEWEYMARAGSDNPFPNGRKLVQYTHAIFKRTPTDPDSEPHPELGTERYAFEQRPAPSGSKPGDADHPYRRTPNKWGLYDLSGNVWEWCQDYYADYPAHETTDPSGPVEGIWKVLRGGAFDTSATECRVAHRHGLDPSSRAMNIGFRVVYAAKRK